MTVGESHGQMDARAVLDFTERLRAARQQVEACRASDRQKRGWQTRLAAISTGAATDLDRAEAQLRRLVSDIERLTA